MKWTSLLFLIALGAASAAEQRTPVAVQKALNDAVLRERQAIVRYEAFAEKAEAEGYNGVAALFHAAASSEAVHLRRFTTLMTERGLTAPLEPARPVAVASTRENLGAAIGAEIAERDGAYREAIEACTTNHDAEAAKVFDQTRDAEVEHANLCSEAGRNLEQMKAPQEYQICPRCGYTSCLRLGFCPLCRQVIR